MVSAACARRPSAAGAAQPQFNFWLPGTLWDSNSASASNANAEKIGLSAKNTPPSPPRRRNPPEPAGADDAMKHSGQTGAGRRWQGLALACLLLAGCRTPSVRLPPLPPNAIKPVVAVSLFENETGFAGQWKLGRGIPDLLVAELLATGYVEVVDRQHISAVVNEIKRQGQDLFRKENVVARGRLKNARYLVRGAITDFTQTGSASGWFRTPQVSGGLTGSRAVVMVGITLIDIETGEILKSISAGGTARASGQWAKFDYRGVAFGGEAFFRTPIGVATREAINKAVVEIVQAIPIPTWQPRIADATAELAIINGGANMGVNIGDIFHSRTAGRPIADPETGDIIGHHPGADTGRLQVIRVTPTAAEALVIEGRPLPGHYLEKIAAPPAR